MEVRYIEVLFYIFYYYWGKENRSLYRGLLYIEVRYIEVSLYFVFQIWSKRAWCCFKRSCHHEFKGWDVFKVYWKTDLGKNLLCRIFFKKNHHSSLAHYPSCRTTSLLPLLISLYKGKRSFKPYQNEHQGKPCEYPVVGFMILGTGINDHRN